MAGASVSGPVQVLIESQQEQVPSVRTVPEEMRSALGPGSERARLHTDESANIAARAVGAQAFALGRDIFFARDRFQPATDAGRALLAHELTHVIESPNSTVIARTPGVAYSDERKAAEAAFTHLLIKRKDALDREWGGYIYRKDSGNGKDAFYHSESRTDNNPHSVVTNTERYAMAAAEDAQVEHARNPGSSPKPEPFKPTRDWVEAEDVQDQGGRLTATYHIHPRVKNKAHGFSDELNGPNAAFPHAVKRTGDIPAALREGLNSYMIDLDEPDPSSSLGYPIHEYLVAQHQADKQDLDAIVGIDPNLGNEWKCQFGFKPDGTIDEDGSACKNVPPSKDAMKMAEEIVKSRVFAVAVEMGDISKSECLRMLKAADMSDDVALCGIDPRTPEQRRRDELERTMQILERLQHIDRPTAHDWL